MTSPTLERMIRAGCGIYDCQTPCIYPECVDTYCVEHKTIKRALSTLDTPDDALIEAMGNAIGISLGDAHWEPQSESYEWVKEHGEEARAALRAAVDHILGRKP